VKKIPVSVFEVRLFDIRIKYFCLAEKLKRYNIVTAPHRSIIFNLVYYQVVKVKSRKIQDY